MVYIDRSPEILDVFQSLVGLLVVIGPVFGQSRSQIVNMIGDGLDAIFDSGEAVLQRHLRAEVGDPGCDRRPYYMRGPRWNAGGHTINGYDPVV